MVAFIRRQLRSIPHGRWGLPHNRKTTRQHESVKCVIIYVSSNERYIACRQPLDTELNETRMCAWHAYPAVVTHAHTCMLMSAATLTLPVTHAKITVTCVVWSLHSRFSTYEAKAMLTCTVVMYYACCGFRQYLTKSWGCKRIVTTVPRIVVLCSGNNVQAPIPVSYTHLHPSDRYEKVSLGKGPWLSASFSGNRKLLQFALFWELVYSYPHFAVDYNSQFNCNLITIVIDNK